jgi:hypothetical protein
MGHSRQAEERNDVGQKQHEHGPPHHLRWRPLRHAGVAELRALSAAPAILCTRTFVTVLVRQDLVALK